MTTTSKPSLSFFVATLIGTAIGGFPAFASPALAQSSTAPASYTPAAATVPAPDGAPARAPVQTAQADTNDEAPPSEPAAPAPEMKFGHGAARAQNAAAPEPAGDTPVMVIPRPRTMEEVAGQATQELTIHNVRWRYSLNFFGDISFSANTRPGEDEGKLGFGLGAQDFLIRGELGNNIVATTEMAVEPGDFGVGIDLERFNVRWQSSQFFLEAGRTHTQFGYWNNAYHHGRWLQPTIARPRWVAFEDDGGMLPVHWVGFGGGARLPISSATLNINLTVGNGRGAIVDDVRNSHDDQIAKAYHGSAELVGIGRPELRMGIAGVVGKIPGQATNDRPALPYVELTEVIGSAHIAYVNVPLLIIAEGYDVAHVALGHQWTTYGGFLLLGYTIGRVTPYLLAERIASMGGQDPFFIPDPNAEPIPSFDSLEVIGGLRVDLSDWTAIKAEYRQTKEWDKRATAYTGIVNWSWGF